MDTARSVALISGQATAFVSEEDAEIVLGFRWHLFRTKGRSYARTSLPRVDGRNSSLLLHRLIANRMGILGPGLETDHWDGDGLNCRRGNLRAATHAQNLANRGPQRNNRSGFKGVGPAKGKWAAQIQMGRRTRNLGSFDDPETAARVYDMWARAAFGSFAYLNFPDS